MSSTSQTQIVFSIPSYREMADEIVAALSAKGTKPERGIVETRTFADGERYMRIQTPVRGLDAVLIGGTVDDGSTLDIFDLACGLVAEGCRSLKIVIPFFGYSTMERAVKIGEVVTAKTRARILSAVPNAPFGNEVWMLDLHSEGIPFYFEGPVKTRHLYAKSLVLEEAKRIAGRDPFLLGAPDAGRAKWVESLANDLGVSAAFVFKRRQEDGTVKLTGVNLPIQGTHVILYDDMIRTGGSILQAAQAYRDAGANRISLIATHGLFSEKADVRLLASGLFDAIAVTDSHPNSRKVNSSKIRILNSAPLIAAYLTDSQRSVRME